MTSVARSDHDSGDYSDASHQEIEQDISGNDGGQPESDYESQGSESDRSDRDPENQEAERRVDDDEDRSNPQYIPKKGTFYEHDDRTAASGEESTNTTSETTSDKKEGSETPGERRRPPRKSESINKWSHDKYNEIEQVPKSRDELVAIYGYDIRNEDAPPHARRNRRYGRGPNKYTRTWEDEEAYRRQAQAQQLNRKPPTAEDFPELDASHRMSKKRVPRPRSKSQPSSNDSIDSGSALRRNASVKTAQGRPSPRPANRIVKSAPRRDVKEIMPPIENLTISATVFNNNQGPPQRKVNATVAQQRPVPTEQKKRPPPQSQPLPQNNNVAPNKSPPQQQTASPQQQRQPNKQQLQHNQQSQQQQAPSGVESRGGSKRYSSLRQRPLDTYSPQQQNQPPQQQQPSQQQQGQQHRYHGDYPNNAPPAHQGSPVPQLHPQQLMQQMHRGAPVPQATHGPSPPHQPLPQQQLPQQQLPQQQLPQQQLAQQQLPQQQLAQQQLPQPQISQQQLPQQQISQQQLPQQHAQQVRLGMMEQPPMVPHGHHPIHTMPPQPHNMGQLQPAQGYAPPAMMPAQYMQQQSGSGAVFTGAPIYAQPPAPYPHQMYTPHHNYAPAPGMTYYTCPEPEQPPRAQRRSAAIPIVRPAAPPASDRPANSSEKDNIDRIVENMFVRKPWPAQGVDSSKEKPSDQRVSQEPPSKESSQPNSLTSSSISTDSKPSESREEKEETKEEQKPEAPKLEEPDSPPESIPDA